MSKTTRKKRFSLYVNGIVQGIGFRPFVYRLAESLNLTGFVKNTPSGVNIEIEGSSRDLSSFKEKLLKEAPPLSKILSFSSSEVPIQNSIDFKIESSLQKDFHNTLVAPDIAICKDCLKELFSKDNRRYKYPFINCTNCGPRYTIIEKLPYDRVFTSMKSFSMCNLCQAEYDNPLDRRFHAQPNACFTCGPKIWLERNNEVIEGETEYLIDKIVKALLDGLIVALKGLGGFHLVVDASNEAAVTKLRQRKQREKKPFALMVLDIDKLSSFAFVSSEEEVYLSDVRRPIVLLRKRNREIFSMLSSVSSNIGVMLPYTPLHYILLEAFSKASNSSSHKALVMTSANISDEPLVMENKEALCRLSSIADMFVMHNRDIFVRCDDSVLSINKGKVSFIRRSRGFTPLPISLPFRAQSPILALGGDLKNTFCLVKEDKAFLSQHIGDLSNYEAYSFFKKSISHLKEQLAVEPKLIVSDMHPLYFSSKWADNKEGVSKLKVQHHHAHLASCMAENGLSGDRKVIGLIMDGTGYGLDNSIWGGEVLIGDYRGFDRYFSFEPYPLIGGDKSIKDVWLIGFAYIYTAYGANFPKLPFIMDKIKERGQNEIDILCKILDNNINCVKQSSCGRLFDAIAAILSLGSYASYEGEVAIKLMEEAKKGSFSKEFFDFSLDRGYILLKALIKSIVGSYVAGMSPNLISQMFHNTLVRIFKAIVISARRSYGINSVALSGGVFQNDILFSLLREELLSCGFVVYVNSKVPCNDGGLSLGQASVGVFALDSF